jgi:hypothetical protein
MVNEHLENYIVPMSKTDPRILRCKAIRLVQSGIKRISGKVIGIIDNGMMGVDNGHPIL